MFEGYQVIVLADAAAALRRINGEFPDVVLLGIRMPRRSGEDVLKNLALAQLSVRSAGTNTPTTLRRRCWRSVLMRK